MADCPSEQTIVDFLDGKLDAQRGGAVHAHVDRCEPCRALLASLAPSINRSTIDEREQTHEEPAKTGAMDEAHRTAPLTEPPDHAAASAAVAKVVASVLPLIPVDRYDVRDEFARGGLGRIFRAHDRRLARPGRGQAAHRRRHRGGAPLRPRGADHGAPAAPGDRPHLRGGPLALGRAVLRHEAGVGPLARRGRSSRSDARRAAHAPAQRHRRRRGDGLRAQPAHHPSRPEAGQRARRQLRRDGGHRLGPGQGSVDRLGGRQPTR